MAGSTRTFFHLRLRLNDLLARQHLLHVGQRVGLLVFKQDAFFISDAGVTHFEFEHEAVDLAFRKRVGSGVLGGVLRGDHEEWIGQLARHTFSGDLMLAHGLEQRALRARRGAVDFVCEQNVGEDRPFTELETAVLLLVDAGAQNVGGQ